MKRALALGVLLLALNARAQDAAQDDADIPLAPEPEPAAMRKTDVLTNAIAFAFLGPNALADVVLLAASGKNAGWGIFAAFDGVALGLDLTFLLLKLNKLVPQRSTVGPQGLSIWHAVTSTSRAYCARPGVDSCAEYDSLGSPPMGDVVDFRPLSSYLGRYVRAELFPLGWTRVDGLLQGFGVEKQVNESLRRVQSISRRLRTWS